MVEDTTNFCVWEAAMANSIVTLGRFSISVDEETDALCQSLKEKAKKLAKLRGTSASKVMQPLLAPRLKEIEEELKSLALSEE
jgi:hypothetical protein